MESNQQILLPGIPKALKMLTLPKEKEHTEADAHGSKCRHEQRHGMIISLFIHSIIFLSFFAFSLAKSTDEVKTYYIQFTQMGEQTIETPQPHVQGIKKPSSIRMPQPVQDMKKPTDVQPVREELREEQPVIKEPPVNEHEAVIRNNAIEIPNAVKAASSSEPVAQPQVAQLQGSSNEGSSAAYNAPSESAGAIETEFGSSSAPRFLKRHMPVYPMMAKKLGKEGKVVLRLFIDEKGILLNVEVVEPAAYGFTESAVEAVKMSSFSPAHEKGVSVPSKALLTIRFVLED